MRLIGRWGAPLRLARRTARRSPGRTLLIAALIGLPVLAAGWVAVIQASITPTGERLARQEIGTADAVVTVTTTSRTKVERFMGSNSVAGHVEPPDVEPQDPSKVDVRSLLPAGTTIVRSGDGWSSAVSARGPDAIGDYEVRGVEGDSPLTRGTFRLDTGRMPSGADEVALSPSLADQLGLRRGGSLIAGATLTTTAGDRYAVTGLARRIDDPKAPLVWVRPGTPLAATPANATIGYLADLPDGTDLTALQQRLADRGVVLTPRSWVVDPPALDQPAGMGTDEAAGWAAVALVIGFGVLEIVLLAGTAFAVGARRQTRELGLVTASGGTPSDVRRIVLAQGLFLGIVGTVAGTGLAIGAAMLAKPVWEQWFNHLIDSWTVPVVPLVVIGAVGVFAGLAAAIVPAVTAGRQEPVAALARRFTVARGNGRLRRGALVLLAAGITLVLAGTTWLGAEFAEAKRQAAANPEYGIRVSVTSTGPIALVLLGITAVIAALVWLLPNLVARAATFGRVLPLSGRLALRDAARHRHRTGPAAAAIMMSVGGTVALAFAMVNSFAVERTNYMPAAPEGTVVVSYDEGFEPAGQSRLKPYSPDLVRQVEQRLPVREHYDIAVVERRQAKPASATQGYRPRFSVESPMCTESANGDCYSISSQVIAVDPGYLDRIGGFGPAADALRAGRLVVPANSQKIAGGKLVVAGRAKVTSDEEAGARITRSVPATVVPGLPRMMPFSSVVLVSPQVAARLGDLRVTDTHFELTRSPTEDELAGATAVVGNHDAIVLERGYQSHAGAMFLALLSAATVVTLLGVAIAVALSAAEGRSDLATLAAVGAPPRRRRSLAAAQAWVVGEIGCLLGVGVGALYGYTAHVAFGSPSMAVPWRELAGILIAVPLFAAALAWLLTRSRLPMVRRVE